MPLPNIYTPPPGAAGWREYWFSHFQDHLEILEAIQAAQNVKLTTYVIDPWMENDKTGILERHQQYHNDMNKLLNLSGSDLSEIDLKDPETVKEWVHINFLEHTAARQSLAI